MTVKIMIDPGHGGSDPGAVGNGLKEKDLTLKIAIKTKEYLDKHYAGHITRLTRQGDYNLPLNDRTNMANEWGADYFLSIHINSGGGSGYEDFIYNGKVQAETSRLRDQIHTLTSKAVDWKNRGKKKANFHVLRETRMPAMLTENGFIDSKADSDKLKQNSTINAIAKAHAEGLAKAFKLSKKEVKGPMEMYYIQIGAFKVKANAEKYLKEVKKYFPDAFIKKE